MEDNQSYRTTVKLKEKKGKCKNDTSNKEIFGARFWMFLLVNLKDTKPMG